MVLATSVNISRRLSVHCDERHQVNENKGNDLAFCQQMSSQVSNAMELPAICRNFPSVVDSVNGRQSSKQPDTPMDIAFQGMPSGSAIQARRSRSMGYEHHAKLQRRLTSSGSNHHYQPQAAR